MPKVRHVLGISGGKDSAALAVYMRQQYPNLDIEYYFCDTGKELTETYELLSVLESYLGKPILRLKAAAESNEDPFDHYLQIYGGFLPSSNARWCTKKLKLEPFEKYVGTDPVISYVGIRDDEDREGYISRKPNIQSIFPFRANIWSEDVISKVLANDRISSLISGLESLTKNLEILEVAKRPVTAKFPRAAKLRELLTLDVISFNKVVMAFLSGTSYPLAHVPEFPLVDNADRLNRADIFNLLLNTGVGVPSYYDKKQFVHEDGTGEYARSRSGCFFCFFQQKIEWVWLYEQHPDLFEKAMSYEKDGFTWQDESLKALVQPERIARIKADHIAKSGRATKSPYLLDVLETAEEEGCAACFI